MPTLASSSSSIMKITASRLLFHCTKRRHCRHERLFVSLASSPSTVHPRQPEYRSTEQQVVRSLSSSASFDYSPICVAATRQHVGKTSVSLALMSGLIERFGKENVGFMKPVGQKSLPVQDENGQTIQVDKDAALIKSYFNLNHQLWKHTSPVLIPQGYTKDYLDGKISYQDQIDTVLSSYSKVKENSSIVLCEGTGHCAVGNIVDVCNADVASLLQGKMVLVANGGLGSAIDELSLNIQWCMERNVSIAGIVINQIQLDKYDQTVEYITKAIHQKWGKSIPVLGCIPDRPFLGCAALSDLERIFHAALLTGAQHRLRHYRMQDVSIVANSLEVFLKQLRTNAQSKRTLYVCHASRTDILLGYLMESTQRLIKQQEEHEKNPQLFVSFEEPNELSVLQEGESPSFFESAMVVTGCNDYPISTQILQIITSLPSESAPPILLTDTTTDTVLYNLYNYTPKLNIDDARRVTKAIEHYQPHINFDLLLEQVRIPKTNQDDNNDDTPQLKVGSI